jgi:Transposase DDE domain
VCAGVRAGEIVVFDKAYVDFTHLADLSARNVFWVTRAKDNLRCRVVRKFQPGVDGNLLRDDLIALTNPPVKKAYPVELRRVVALVEVDGELREMVFLTNNLEWSAQTIADLYRCRWQIEVFFKQIKQTLQLADFLGNSANAVRWQVWTALLTLCAVALLRLVEPVGPQFHPPLCLVALGPVAKTRTPQPARSLWDSRGRRLVPGVTLHGVSWRGFQVGLWRTPRGW